MDFQQIIDWSESWLPVIPLMVVAIYPKQPSYLKPVIVYLCASFILNTISNIIWLQQSLRLSLSTDNNTPIYNIHSICRFFLFSLFFIKLNQPFAQLLKRIMPVLFIAFIIVDLLCWEHLIDRKIANNIHSAEAGLLIMYSLMFFFYLLRQESFPITKLPTFWIVTGLIVFAVVSFPIYLFYERLIVMDWNFAIDIWEVQKFSFMVFCIFTAVGFYKSQHFKPGMNG